MKLTTENPNNEPTKPCPISRGLSRALLMQLESAGYDPNADVLGKATINGLKDALAELPDSQVDMRQAFIDKFGIKLLGDFQIAVTLPEGTTRFQFLEEAQMLSQDLFDKRPILPSQLNEWRDKGLFGTKLSQQLEIAAEFGKQPGDFRQDELEKIGWLNLCAADIAVAHTALFIAKGGDMPSWYLLMSSTAYLLYEGGNLQEPSSPYTIYVNRYHLLPTRSLLPNEIRSQLDEPSRRLLSRLTID